MPAADPVAIPPISKQYASRAHKIPGSIIDSSVGLLQRQTHDIVRFAMGSPAAEAVPTAELRALGKRAFDRDPAGALDYGPTEGEASLRTALLEWLERNGVEISAKRLLVTAGGMQGLDLACKLFVEPRDLVITEAPTYTNGAATILSYEGHIAEVPVDDDGMRVDELERIVADLGRAPKLIYTIPNFQNPSGTTLSLERRRRLVELAERWNTVLLEDDPYGMLRFEGESLPSLATLAPPAVTVVGVFTFSKILAAGLRVGWVAAEPDVIARMTDARQGMDTCTNVPMQRVVGEFVACGVMDEHLARLRAEYRGRKRTLQDALERHLGSGSVSWTDPEGGFFLWLTLPEGVSGQSLFPVALRNGVAYIPGGAFSTEGRFDNAVRLCFASSGGSRTDEGVRRLLGTLESAYGSSWRTSPRPTAALAAESVI